ncbi:MAG: hypothetical protein DCC65_11680, partial [Planctomycetota bacterium]
ARALLAGVRVREHPAAPHEDRTALRRLARWMLRFAPVVSPDAPDGLMLDISGCGQLFGGERAHARRIAAALRGWGLHPRLAVAPTFACAWAMARFGAEDIAWVGDDAVRDALSPLPVAALRIAEASADHLADIGIERIEHLWALPRDELAARFGADLLHRLDLLTGAAAETIQPIHEARRFEVAHVFDGPVRRIEIVEATTRQLLAALVEQLHAADRGVVELAAVFRRAGAGPASPPSASPPDRAAGDAATSLRLTYPSRDAAHLWKLLWPRLERTHLGHGVEEIILRAVRTGRVINEQAVFLRETRRDFAGGAVALGELVDHLVSRLGEQTVTRVRPEETYVPEYAFAHDAVREDAPRAAGRAVLADRVIHPAPRPSRLFEPPERARVLSLVPDGPPVWLDWRERSGEVVSGVGPERISFPWWKGGPAVERDYYEVEDEHGRRLWVYRDGGSGAWFVHGQWM